MPIDDRLQSLRLGGLLLDRISHQLGQLQCLGLRHGGVGRNLGHHGVELLPAARGLDAGRIVAVDVVDAPARGLLALLDGALDAHVGRDGELTVGPIGARAAGRALRARRGRALRAGRGRALRARHDTTFGLGGTLEAAVAVLPQQPVGHRLLDQGLQVLLLDTKLVGPLAARGFAGQYLAKTSRQILVGLLLAFRLGGGKPILQ